ncbi:MAG: glycosyltransferase [Desulfovibrio sp.]|jgi:cellulose synthase/poly-beta-1,6-N-acetylglucosamine synthase-like glycosyltransferase|nr:glycosyltransferase [Desulfovibrio sp.]
MLLLCALTALAQCLLFLLLARAGKNLPARAARDAAAPPPGVWPRVALVIPAAGSHPRMAQALESLLSQDYPRFVPILVTAAENEEAAALIRDLQKRFPSARRVVAGRAQGCGQKNHNSLCGVKAAGEAAEVLVFCDSTHPARPDFVRSLVKPIARGEADFTTGYHQVHPDDTRTVTLAYALCVLLLRLLQAFAPFTQPWGGAMAIRRSAFLRYGIAELWADNVVDDCSLAGILPGLGVRVRLCPGAVLDTEAAAHPLPVWLAWMDRQVLFLKFCVPAQWILLGFLCLIMATPLCWAALVLCAALWRAAVGPAVWGSLLYAGILAGLLHAWRGFLPVPVPLLPWLRAFVCAVGMFIYVYARSIPATGLAWHGIRYEVGRGGKVIGMRRPDGPV